MKGKNETATTGTNLCMGCRYGRGIKKLTNKVDSNADTRVSFRRLNMTLLFKILDIRCRRLSSSIAAKREIHCERDENSV